MNVKSLIKSGPECINLNGYKKFRFDESNGNCIYCGIGNTLKDLKKKDMEFKKI